ncbi:MAG: glycosyltransferase family 9 protein [Planctomycetota bacterium]|nr:glycosyltransferase family 9 protein [Planctomycetota bacterium]
MKLNFMRWVDYWVGIPICLLFSLFTAIKRGLGFGKIDERFKPGKLLFIELSEMGSTVLAYGAMQRAKELFQAELHFLIFDENKESVELLGIIPDENLHTIRSKSFIHFFFDTFGMVFKMRRQRFDAVIDLELFSRFTSILCFLSGARANVGYYKYHMEGLYRGTFQTHKVMYNPYYHMTQNFMSLISALEEVPTNQPMVKKHIRREDIARAKVEPREDGRETVLRKLREQFEIKDNHKLVLLNAGAGNFLAIRKWPLENFIAFSRQALEMPDTVIAVVGVPADHEEGEIIREKLKTERFINFAGETDNLRELVELFHLSVALVTNDSGPAHFASLTDIRVITLFGPETPSLYGPVGEQSFPMYSNYACSPCVSAYNHRKTKCGDNKCLQAITPESVFEQVRPVLE